MTQVGSTSISRRRLLALAGVSAILHDDDQIVPIGASALLSSKIVQGATLKGYPGAPHGMCSTLKDQVNAELLAFIGQMTGANA